MVSVMNHRHFGPWDIKFHSFAVKFFTQCPILQCCIFLGRLCEPAPGIVPAAHRPLALLLAYVLAYIAHRRAVLSVQRQGGGESERPPRAIVHNVSPGSQPLGPLLRRPGPARLLPIREPDGAGIHKLKMSRINEPVEMSEEEK